MFWPFDNFISWVKRATGRTQIGPSHYSRGTSQCLRSSVPPGDVGLTLPRPGVARRQGEPKQAWEGSQADLEMQTKLKGRWAAEALPTRLCFLSRSLFCFPIMQIRAVEELGSSLCSRSNDPSDTDQSHLPLCLFCSSSLLLLWLKGRGAISFPLLVLFHPHLPISV